MTADPFDDHLSTELQRAVRTYRPPDRLGEVRAAGARRGPRRTPVWAVAAGIVVVAAIGGVIGLANHSDTPDQGQRVISEPGPSVDPSAPTETSAVSGEPRVLELSFLDGTTAAVDLPPAAEGWVPYGPTARVTAIGFDEVRPVPLRLERGSADDVAARRGGVIEPGPPGSGRVTVGASTYLLIEREIWTVEVHERFGGEELLPPGLAELLASEVAILTDGGQVLVHPTASLEIESAEISLSPEGTPSDSEIVLTSSTATICRDGTGDDVAIRCFLDGTVHATAYGAAIDYLDDLDIQPGG